MMDERFRLLGELSDKIVRMDNKAALSVLLDEYASKIDMSEDASVQHIISNMKKLAEALIESRNDRFAASLEERTAGLTDKEKEEFAEVNRIIDNNLFDYHFQPIVSAIDGSIYSFEALMRPVSELCPSPLHVLKYAKMAGRLEEVERATFYNVLEIVDKKMLVFGNRRVFINSMPSIKLEREDFDNIKPIMIKHSDNVVIEMTEWSEMRDDDLADIKRVYQDIGIRFALDDYGTGYSNVNNLIRYTPDYVKIDRSLISGVDSSHKKQHFVHEIVEFCHDNHIMALAEGVETSEEMRAVIALGVDLIQGYYTARPGSDIIAEIPENIRNEIKKFNQERDRDKELGIYCANYIDKLYLDTIVSNGFSCIQINSSDADGNVIITGSPDSPSSIYIDIMDGFHGDLILDGTVLSNTRNKPCIDIGENCDVNLILIGMNRLIRGGIRVPESSTFTCAGDGVIDICVDGQSFYAIGNDEKSRHGKLVFEQGVIIENNSASGVCIGSGLGGDIEIRKGKFELSMRGFDGVAIGSFSGDANIDFSECDVSVDFNFQRGVGIGTRDGDCNVSFSHSSIRTRLSGRDVIGIGSFEGRSCNVKIEEASAAFNIVATDCSAIAALKGETKLVIHRANVNIQAQGGSAYAVGYSNSLFDITVDDADFKVSLSTDASYIESLRDYKFDVNGGRVDIIINDSPYYQI